MSNIMTLKAQIARIRSRISAVPTFATGRPADDLEAERCERALQQIGDEIGLVLRELKQKANIANMIANSISGLPADAKFRAQQSAKDRNKEVDEVFEECKQLQKDIEKLITTNSQMSLLQIGRTAIEQITSTKESYEGLTAAPYPVFKSQESLHASPEAIVAALTLTVAYIHKAVIKWRQARLNSPKG